MIRLNFSDKRNIGLKIMIYLNARASKSGSFRDFRELLKHPDIRNSYASGILNRLTFKYKQIPTNSKVSSNVCEFF